MFVSARRRTHQSGAGDALRRRHGAILVLVAVCLVMLMGMAMLTVDVAQIQLARTELRAATDAAAKAGAEALMREQDVDAARDAAIAMAARNTVSGKPLVLQPADVLIGRAEQTDSGAWLFYSGDPPNSVRVNATLSSTTASGPVELSFSQALGADGYEPSTVSTASVLEQEICLAVDRSHSMCFDLSGVDWVYPPGHPRWPHPICFPPRTHGSRWGAVMSAVDRFTRMMEARSPAPRVALVTWASDIGTETPEYQYTGSTSSGVTVDSNPTYVVRKIKQLIDNRAGKWMLGGTDMASGIDKGVGLLTAPGIKKYARRVLVLLTDGHWNMGRNPVLAAEAARDAGLIVHTISFLPGAVQPELEQIAEMTGGRSLHADNEEELIAAFEEIAEMLPVVLTD